MKEWSFVRATLIAAMLTGGAAVAAQDAPPPAELQADPSVEERQAPLPPEAGPQPTAPAVAPATAAAAAAAPVVRADTWIRVEGRENADFADPSANDPREEMGRLRVSITWAEGDLGALLQPQYVHRNVSRPVAGTDIDALQLHQAYLDMAAAEGRFRVGRQEFAYGDQRLIGHFGWHPVGRSFDAVRGMWRLPAAAVDIFHGRLGNAPVTAQRPSLSGVYGVLDPAGPAVVDTYLLHKGDRVAGQSQSIWTLGSRPRWTLPGGWDVTAEGAYQFGRNFGRDHEAWAYAATVGYRIPGPLNLRFAVGHDAASGGDPTGEESRTFDQLFPTNHFHYGTMDLVGWRNMRNWRASLLARPSPQWSIAVDAHRFQLQNPADFWYNAGGLPVRNSVGAPRRDPTGAAGRDLGTEVDVTVTATPAANWSVSGGVSRFWPGAFVRRTNPGGRAAASDWFYLQAGYRL